MMITLSENKIETNSEEKSNAVYVYVAEKLSDLYIDGIFPIERREEILQISNADVRRMKYSVWKLLEYALDKTFGLKIRDAELIKNSNGKWISPFCCISLSHSDNAVCVALSKTPVGVDIETKRVPSKGFSERILNEAEKTEYLKVNDSDKADFLISKWTQKESLFKLSDESKFMPKDVNTFSAFFQSFRVNVNNSEQIVTVATRDLCRVKLITDVRIM